MKNSTKTLLYSGAAIVAILIGLTIFVSIKDNRHLESIEETVNVLSDNKFTSGGIDSLSFNFPDYGHVRITVSPGDCDSIVFSSSDIAKQIIVTDQDGVLTVSTVKGFGEYLMTDITVTLKNIPVSISTNGVEVLTLTDITADSMKLNLKQNVAFENCDLKSTDIKLATNYGPKCIISGKDSRLGNTCITTIEAVYVTEGVSFDLLTLVGSEPEDENGEVKKVLPRNEILRDGPLILFQGTMPSIKIEKGEYPFGVYIDGPYKFKYDLPTVDNRD